MFELMHMVKLSFFIAMLSCCLGVTAQTEGTIQNGGSAIFYRTYGSGEPLLIINGGPGMNSEGFTGLATMLSVKYQTIIYDQRGTGRSSLSPIDHSTITMKLMVEDIESLREHLHIKHWNVLGHSFGGMLASYYATMHPDKITSLILSSSGGIDLDLLSYVNTNIQAKLSREEARSLQYWNSKIAAGDTSHHARLQRGMALAAAYVYDRTYVPVIADRLTQGNAVINGLVWDDLRKIKFDCKSKLSTFHKPVLVIQGKQDILEERTALKALQAFDHSKLVLLDKCGHYGWLDARPAYLEAIEVFLSAN